MKVLINCPVCGIELNVRSLESHLEHAHEIPGESDIRIRLHPGSPYTITPQLVDQPEPEKEPEPEPEKEPEPEPEKEPETEPETEPESAGDTSISTTGTGEGKMP